MSCLTGLTQIGRCSRLRNRQPRSTTVVVVVVVVVATVARATAGVTSSIRLRSHRCSESRSSRTYTTRRYIADQSSCLYIIIIIMIIMGEILDPIFSIQVRAYSSRKPWRLQFYNSELYFRTRPPNLCSHRRRERNFVPIPTHFYHATTLQLRAFARHSAS